MSVTLKWKFPKIEKDKNSNLENTITSVEYVIEGTDGINTVSRSGKVILDSPTTDTFIPYENISNNIMAQWISDRFPELLEAHTINITSELNYLNQSNTSEEIPHFSE